MPTIFQTKDRSGKPHRNWRIKYIDHNGKRKTITGLQSKTETEKLAWKIQAENDEIRKGLRAPPKESAKKRLFADVAAEYLAWGESQGGHGGRPWSAGNRKVRRGGLKYWTKQLRIGFLHELYGSLPRVEEALREKQKAGRSGKTLQTTAESLAALCDWAVKRGYLDSDPLKNLQKFDITPLSTRRALTPDEVARLLATAPPARRLLYEVALASGLRVKELHSLVVQDFDQERGGFNLKSAWTKNRKNFFQPLPKSLVEKLKAEIMTRSATDKLLSVPKARCKYLYRDMEAAGIPRETADGKLDFHALRITFATFVFDVGASVKEAQTLARHSTPDLTVNVYAKTRSERLSEIADKLGALVMSGGACPTVVQQPPMQTNLEFANDFNTGTCENNGGLPSAGSIPATAAFGAPLEAGRQGPEGGLKTAQPGQLQGLMTDSSIKHRTLEVVGGTDAGRPGCPTDVHRLIDSLPQLSSASQSALLAMANKPEVEIMMRAFNSAFEIEREILPAKTTSIARRRYIETLRAQGMIRAA